VILHTLAQWKTIVNLNFVSIYIEWSRGVILCNILESFFRNMQSPVSYQLIAIVVVG